MKAKYPLLREGQIGELSFTGTPANKLTKQILKYIQLLGGRAERVRSEGRYIEGGSYTDVLGHKNQMKGKYIVSTSRKGTADITSLCKGKSISIEVKIGKDRQSDAQKQYEQDTINAGGYYIIARTFDQFYNDFNTIING
jgi:hypothetical protein